MSRAGLQNRLTVLSAQHGIELQVAQPKSSKQVGDVKTTSVFTA